MAALSSVAAKPASAAGSAPARGIHSRRRRRLNLFRYLIFIIFGLFFLLPMWALLRFSLEGKKQGSWSISGWKQIFTYKGPPALLSSIELTLGIAALTCVVMLLLVLPTMIWVRLRVRGFSRAFEFLCLLPLTIPAIVLVVGYAPIYNRIERVSVSGLTLFLAYAVLALPYVYRALAAGLGAIDVTTLSEAARSLGAGWGTVMARVIAPNMRQAILNALLLTVALVLGEFTIAYNLVYPTFQVALFEISRNTENPVVLFAASAGALLFTFCLLLALSFVGRRRRRAQLPISPPIQIGGPLGR
jgi:putative spermidine/putrescine transport system permease protein